MEILKISSLAAFEKAPVPELDRSNFEWSFKILPKDRRVAMYSIYNFLSYLDDIVDAQIPRSKSQSVDAQKKVKLERINFWEITLEKLYDENYTPAKEIEPLSYVIRRFNIPIQYFQSLFDGFRRDLTQNRYETFEELKNYCFEVASVVGLISIEIFGYKYEATRNYAINLGYALQLTNIIRDVKADHERGFIYLPLEDFRKFNYSLTDLKNKVYNDNFVNLMNFESQRAKEYYFKARSYLRPEERRSMIAAGIMDEIYFRLLEKIELREYKIFDKRIKVSNSHKLMIALKHFLSVKMFVNRIKKLP
jgi:phytoene synthase